MEASQHLTTGMVVANGERVHHHSALCATAALLVSLSTLATPALAQEVTSTTTASSSGTVATTQSADVGVDSTNHASPTTYHGEPFVLDASFGYEAADLTTFRSTLGARSFTADVVPSNASGPAASVGLGVRFYSLTFGLRGGVAWLGDSSQTNLNLYSIDAEFGIRIPFDQLEAYLLVGGGYSVVGGLSDAINGIEQGLNIDGGNLRAAIGLDYFFSKTFSFGGRFSAEALFLGRRGVAIRDLPNTVNSAGGAENSLLGGSGSSVGTALAFTFGPGLHF